MDPADLYKSEAKLQDHDGTAASQLDSLSASAVTSGAAAKKAPTVQRVDTEVTYTRLKAAIGQSWEDYKDTLGNFILGKISQHELTRVLKPLLSSASTVSTNPTDPNAPKTSTLHLHNTLIAALLANALYRDAPAEPVAPWVLATDTPSALGGAAKAANAAGSGTNNQIEERIKHEVMALSARDRRRIKAVKDNPTASDSVMARNENGAGLHEARLYREMLEPTSRPLTAGGSSSAAASSALAKTNYDVEIKRRFAAQMACESLEFPAKTEIQARIEPICYEQGLNNGVASGATLQRCSELLETAAEMYIKEVLETWMSVVRSDSAGLVQTAAYKARVRREEQLEEEQAALNPPAHAPFAPQQTNTAGVALDSHHRVGDIVRNALGLLPVEAESVAAREPLGIEEVRFALQLGNNKLRLDPFLGHEILSNGWFERHDDDAGAAAASTAAAVAAGTGDLAGTRKNTDKSVNGTGVKAKASPAPTASATTPASGGAEVGSETGLAASVAAGKVNGVTTDAAVDGTTVPVADPDAMDLDVKGDGHDETDDYDNDFGWGGGSMHARGGLMDVLSGCLAVGS